MRLGFTVLFMSSMLLCHSSKKGSEALSPKTSEPAIIY